MRAEEERQARGQQTGQNEALAHLEHRRRRRQAPSPDPKTFYQLEMEVGRGEAEKKERRRGQGSGAAASRVEDHRGRKERQEGPDRGRAEVAARDTQKGWGQGEVRGGKGSRTVRGRSDTASGKEDSGVGGSRE